MLKALIAVIAIFTIDLALTDGPDKAINGVLAELNQPGTISVRITVGDADGVQKGDEFTVRRNKNEIGKLVVIDVDEDYATANIIAADVKLERGDHVIHK
jgi:hypothetical protein